MDTESINPSTELLQACEQLKERYADYDLNYLLQIELLRRSECKISECECHDPKSMVERLSEIVEKHKFRFHCKKVDKCYDDNIYCGTLLTHLDEQFYEVQERPIKHDKVGRYSRTADLKALFRRLTEEFLHELRNETNHFPHGNDELYSCDCLDWLSWKFSRVRKEAFKLLRLKLGKHNTLATAFVCFCIQNSLLMREELAEMRRAIHGMNEHWKEVQKLISKGYERDRKRELRIYKMEKTTEINREYEEFMTGLKRDYPSLFLRDGSFDNDQLKYMAEGEVDSCNGCANY